MMLILSNTALLFLRVLFYADSIKCSLIIEGVDIEDLPEEQLDGFFNAVDEKFIGSLDIHSGKETLYDEWNSNSTEDDQYWPTKVNDGLWHGGRNLFKNISRTYLTKNGGKVTRHYIKDGNTETNMMHFVQLKPTKVKKFQTKYGKIYTGNIGGYTVKAKSMSTYKGRSTLEFRDEKVVRNFRFDNF